MPVHPADLTLCCTGTRHLTDAALVRGELALWGPYCRPGVPTIVHGGGRGADALVDRVARLLGYRVRVFPADWAREGRAAGPRRNQRMLTVARPDLVLAFWDGRVQGSGTLDTMRRAVRLGIEVMVVPVPLQNPAQSS